MHLYHHYHLPRLTELKRLYAAHALTGFASALVSVFVPIYMYELGFPVERILLFFVFAGALLIPITRLAFWMMSRIGSHRTMAVGVLSFICFFVLLSAIRSPEFHWLFLLALGRAGMQAFYWPALHVNFTEGRAHQRTGRQVGLLAIVFTLANGLGPAIGGILATLVGIQSVYVTSIVLGVLAGVPLLGGSVVNRQPSLPAKAWRYVFRVPRDVLSNFAMGVIVVTEVFLWPFLIFLKIPNYASVGILSSLLMLVSVAATIYVSRKEDRIGDEPFIKQGAWFGSAGNTLRLFAESATHVAGINVIGGVSSAVMGNSHLTRYYRNSDKAERLAYIYAMEIGFAVAWTGVFAVLWVLSFWLPTQALLLVGIALSIPASFGTRLIR